MTGRFSEQDYELFKDAIVAALQGEELTRIELAKELAKTLCTLNPVTRAISSARCDGQHEAAPCGTAAYTLSSSRCLCRR